MAGEVVCSRSGRKFTMTFGDGTVEPCYHVLACLRNGTAFRQIGHVGYACQVADHHGKNQGWIIRNSEGEVIFGLGASTKLGKGLDDCLFMFARTITPEVPDAG